MTMIEIRKLENGAHNNQTTSAIIPVPEGWAVLPTSVGTPQTLENFPFGEITVDDSTPPIVTSWTPSTMPEPAPVDPEPTLDERVANLEAALAQTDETAIELYEAQAEQEAINAAQDEALIEIYEMMEG